MNGSGPHDSLKGEKDAKQNGHEEADPGEDGNDQEVIVIQDTGFTVKICAPGIEPFSLQVPVLAGKGAEVGRSVVARCSQPGRQGGGSAWKAPVSPHSLQADHSPRTCLLTRTTWGRRQQRMEGEGDCQCLERNEGRRDMSKRLPSPGPPGIARTGRVFCSGSQVWSKGKENSLRCSSLPVTEGLEYGAEHRENGLPTSGLF